MLIYSQWRRHRGSGAIQGATLSSHCPYPKFWVVGKLLENFLRVGKRSSENAKFGAETTHFGGI